MIGDHLREAVLRLMQAGIESPLLDAQLLMAKALGCSRLDVISHPERDLGGPEAEAFVSLIERRAARQPLAYLTGAKEFHGIEIEIRPGVLVPRPETELLVDETLARLGPGPRVVADVGTGSGAIAIAIAVGRADLHMYATEISHAAAEVARANIEKHHLADSVELLEGDLLAPLEAMGIAFDAIVSNPPYIPSGDIDGLQPEIALYEPREALDGGPDGLDVYRKLLPGALGLLREDGFAAVEVGAGQANLVRALAESAGFRESEIVRDLAGIERVVLAFR